MQATETNLGKGNARMKALLELKKNAEKHSRKIVLLGVTGYNSSMFAISIIKELLKSNVNLIIIRDSQAEKTISEESLLETFNKEVTESQLIVLTDKDEWDFWKERMVVLHIYLRNLVDSLLFGPMSASILAKMANGLCDDLLVRIHIIIDMCVQSMEFREAIHLHTLNAF